jgi:hypothetical protein
MGIGPRPPELQSGGYGRRLARAGAGRAHAALGAVQGQPQTLRSNAASQRLKASPGRVWSLPEGAQLWRTADRAWPPTA